MNKLRKLIQEELYKVQLNERKKGNTVVVKIAKMIRDTYIEAVTKHLTSYPKLLEDLEEHYEHYLNVKNATEPLILLNKEDAKYVWDLNRDPFRIAMYIKRFIFHGSINKKDVTVNIPKKMGKELTGTDLHFAPIKIELYLQSDYEHRDLSNTRGSYISNEKNTKGISTLSIVVGADAIRDFVQGTNIPIKARVTNLIDSRYSTIIHEVQHYYDDMRDDDFTGSISKGYDSSDPKLYYTHPTEINTFFTQAANSIDLRNKDWYEVRYLFFDNISITKVIKYGGEKMRKYYSKRLYTLWSQTNRQHIMQKRTVDITSKVERLEKELDAKYPDGTGLFYNHSTNAISIDVLRVPTVEEEIEVHKQLIKLADRYRKNIVLDLEKGWTARTLGVARKYLKDLGYRKNRGNRRDFRYDEEYIRNSKR